jgi:hypothetical protein
MVNLLASDGTPQTTQRDAHGENMKEHPILFSAPMVRAILNGRKTQTRRVVKPHDKGWTYSIVDDSEDGIQWLYDADEAGDWHRCSCPHGKPGDKLWVRETHLITSSKVEYRADYHQEIEAEDRGRGLRWRPSIFMPRCASRITLEITDVRVERLREISEADAQAEGVIVTKSHVQCAREFDELRPDLPTISPAQQAYCELWESINGAKHSWASDPWVWVLTFKRLSTPTERQG